MINLAIISAPVLVKALINVLYYLSAIGIVVFAFRLIRKRQKSLPIDYEKKRIIICAIVAFLSLIVKALI